MRYVVPCVLWTLVLVAGGTFFYMRAQSASDANSEMSNGQLAVDNPDGAVIVEVPWKHLPDVDRFQLTDQNGNTFDSADLMGKPYVVSFFFATCPTICRDLNRQIERANQALKDTDIQFLTITVDPKNDTPEVLHKYAEGFGATPDRWAFLTGQMYKLKEIGEHMFNVVVDRDTHTDDILLVDKWGRYRDRFKWNQPYDMKRFLTVAREVAAETDPPLDQKVKTRNAMAGVEHPDLSKVPWIRDFHLTERSGEKFYSRDLVGDVWIGNFFFSTCPGICKKQNQYLHDLQKRLAADAPRIVSITTDPTTDTPERLREVATQLEADPDNWLFCTGPVQLIERIGSEFFRAPADGDHHSSLLFVVDRWGDVRGEFDWQQPQQEIEMMELIRRLRSETRPMRPEDPVATTNTGSDGGSESDGESESDGDSEADVNSLNPEISQGS